eukprot:1072750-Rhodomonas_salina.3
MTVWSSEPVVRRLLSWVKTHQRTQEVWPSSGLSATGSSVSASMRMTVMSEEQEAAHSLFGDVHTHRTYAAWCTLLATTPRSSTAHRATIRSAPPVMMPVPSAVHARLSAAWSCANTCKAR